MNKIRPVAALVLLVSSSIFASITILENTATRLVFKWGLDGFDTTSMQDSGKRVTAISFSDYNIALGNEGEPVIPGVSLFAGIPATGSVRLHFAPGPIRTVRLLNPLRKNPSPRATGSAGKKDNLEFSDQWVSSPHYTWFRSLRTVNVVVRPVHYEPSAGVIQVLESGVCTIEFPAGNVSTSQRPSESDYERMLKKLVLNYNMASGWARAAQRPLRKTASDPYPMGSGTQIEVFKIGDGYSGTNEATIRENGIVKIPGAQVLRLFGRQPATVAMSSVALYASWKGQLPELCPPHDSIPAGVVEVPLIRIDNNQNRTVDNDDYFLAYVTGLSDWAYDTMNNGFTFRLDQYEDNRSYMLTIKTSGIGATMQKDPAQVGAIDTFNTFDNHILFKQSNWIPVSVNLRSGMPTDQDALGFVWERVTPKSAPFEYLLELPDLDSSVGGSLRFHTFSYWNGVNARLSGDSLCSECENENDYTVGNWGNRQLKVTYADPTALNYWQLISLEANYTSKLSMTRDTLRMHIFPSAMRGPKTYRFSGLNGNRIFIVRVPDNNGTTVLIDSGAGATEFVWSDTCVRDRYFICNEAGFITLPDSAFSTQQRASSSGYVVTDLRNTGNETRYLIVTHPEFMEEAKRLAAHKAQIGFVNPRVVSIHDIYADFAGGNKDPVAIRNFLAFVRRNWRNGGLLDYVVLMGKGHLDFKKVKSSEENFIPPMELMQLFELASVDDFYAALDSGMFNGSSNLALALGRLPCMTRSEAATMVDKIIAMETTDPRNSEWGSWRNSMLFVADDDKQGDDPDPISHYVSSEEVYQLVGSLRPSMELRKTYLFDYPWNSNYEKPEAGRAIINEINNGVGFVNYFGHGSITQWADERVLMNPDVSQLVNNKRYPVIASFSCSVGHFDKPGVVSLSEELVKAPGGGAIATISGTRGSVAPSNTTLARNFYSCYFDTTTFLSIGMAMISAKARSQAASPDDNNIVYAIFGDPSLRLFAPTRRVRIEIADSNGNPLSTDTLQALQPITIKGTIVDANGVTDAGFGSLTTAYVQLGFYNASEMTARKDGSPDQYVRYVMPGKRFFSRSALVRNGTFEQTAILPRNLSFDKTGPRITAYAWEGSTVGLGSRTAFFHGSRPISSAMQKDTSGPLITIRPVYDIPDVMRSSQVSFSDRIVSSLPLKCEIVIDDQSGIDLGLIGPDEGLTLEVPGAISRRNINHKFTGDEHHGTAVWSFEEKSLSPGTHTLAITAQDIFGNVSKASFAIEITPDTAITIDHVFNTPNPMRMGEGTQIFFYPSTTTTQNANMQFGVIIKFYSLSGRLLRVIKNANNGVFWDGKDQAGYQLPPNIYLYQVTAFYPNMNLEKQVRKSKIMKIVIHPPR